MTTAMKKRILLWAATAFAAALAFCACDDGAKDADDRLTDDEAALAELLERLGDVEQQVLQLNVDISTFNTLRGGVVIYSAVDGGSDGWTVTLSDGTVLHVYPQSGSGNAPVVSTDADGYWMVNFGSGSVYVLDVDGNKVSCTGKGATGNAGADGASPILGVDSEGYWKISFDGGSSWERVLDSGGNAVLAVVQQNESLFENVVRDGGMIWFYMKNGEVLKIPVAAGFLCSIKNASGVQSFAAGQTRTFEVESEGVAQAVVTGPAGWTVALDGETLSVTAAATKTVSFDTEDCVAIFAVSTMGYSVISKIQVAISD